MIRTRSDRVHTLAYLFSSSWFNLHTSERLCNDKPPNSPSCRFQLDLSTAMLRLLQGKRLARHVLGLRERIWVFPKIRLPQNGWFIMENPINPWMILGYHYFRKHPYSLLRYLVYFPLPRCLLSLCKMQEEQDSFGHESPEV